MSGNARFIPTEQPVNGLRVRALPILAVPNIGADLPVKQNQFPVDAKDARTRAV
jgi:hypothetical protein